MRIQCPRQLDDQAGARFINAVWRSRYEPELILDFSTLRFVYPAGVLILAIGIRGLVRERTEQGLITHSDGEDANGAPSYLRYFGFFQFIGCDVGNNPNHTAGNTNYLPITEIRREQFSDPSVVIQEQITKYSYDLVSVIYPSRAERSIVDMLAWCLRGIIRNVFEHADTDVCFVMAQRWANGYAELAIADEGVGIPTTLAQKYEITSPRSALRMAIKPGISRIDEPETDYKWQNSGFGLYVVSEFGAEYGGFSILSDGTMLSKANTGESWVPTPVSGTAVKLRVRTDDAEYFPNILQNIVERGEALAGQIPGARVTASKGSRLVDRMDEEER